MDIVLVEWGDAWGQRGAQKIEESDCTPLVTQTVGFLVVDNDLGVVVCPEIWPEEDNRVYDKGEVNFPTFIPRGMIRKITPLWEAAGLSGLSA